MILWNVSDDTLRTTAAIRNGTVNGALEETPAPCVFIFAPGERREVSDFAGPKILERLEVRGLVALRDKDDPEAKRRAGRRAYFTFLERQVRRHRMINQEQRLKGLPGIEPNDQILHCYRKWKELKRTEFGVDEILRDTDGPAPGPIEAPLQGLEESAGEEMARDLMDMTPDEAKHFEDEAGREQAVGLQNEPATP